MSSSEYPKVSIEFCNKCKWGLRSFWYIQEIFQTFEHNIKELSVKPNNDQPGTFRIVGYYIHKQDTLEESPEGNTQEEIKYVTIWDRKVDGGFPDAKTLKKRIKMLLFNDTDGLSIGQHNERPATTTVNIKEGLLKSESTTNNSNNSCNVSNNECLECTN